MVTIAEVKSQITAGKQSIQEQRQQIQEKRGQAEKVRTQITKQERSIPVPTQRTLRGGGLFSGLEGRKRRQILKSAKESLGREKRKVGVFTGELERFEKEELSPYERSIKQAEKEVASYEQQKAEYEQQKALYDYGHKLGSTGKFIPNLKGLAKQGYQDAVNRVAYYSQVSKPTYAPFTPIKPLDIDWSNIKPSDITVGGKTSEQIVTELNKPKIYSPRLSLPVPRDLSRTEVLKSFAPLRKLNVFQATALTRRLTGFATIPFKTTGSPVRYTKITSLSSRGHQPYASNQIRRPSMKIRVRNVQEAKKIPIKTDMDFFSTKKVKTKSTKGKKKSIWDL